MRHHGYTARNGYFGVLQGGATPQNPEPVVHRLLTALPPALPLENAYDVAWNVHLVSAGIRSATLLERADLLVVDESVFDATVAAIRDAVSTQPNVETRMRSPGSATRQFLVYNTSRVTAQDVHDAVDMEDPPAMGKVLGFQCAGQIGSPYSVFFFLQTGDAEPVMFYAEMCNDAPDSSVIARQTRQFNEEAKKFGWSVTSKTDYNATIPMMVQQLLSDSPEFSLDTLLNHCENVGLLVFQRRLEQGLVLTRHTRAILAGLLAYLEPLIDVYAMHNNFTQFMGTYESNVEQVERLLLGTQAVPQGELTGLVVAAAVSQQYDTLNTIAKQVMRAVRHALKVRNMKTPRSPQQWDLLAAVLAVHTLHMPVEGMKGRMVEREQFALYDTLLALDLVNE